MSSLSPTEKEFFEELFGMSSGWILKNIEADITNSKFRSIVKDTTGKNIMSKTYETFGKSKAKRLRAFWETESDEKVAKLLDQLLNIYALKQQVNGEKPEENAIYKQCRNIVQKLSGKKPSPVNAAEEFLQKDFGDVSFDDINIEESIKPILKGRLREAKSGLEANNPMSVIFMCGSILEGLLLAVANKNPKAFNSCSTSPKDKEGKVKPFPHWSLSQFIDVANQLGYLDIDTKKFSHVLRDFRNYIHPYEEMKSEFTPNQETAKICLQVLRAAVVSIENNATDSSTIIEIEEE